MSEKFLNYEVTVQTIGPLSIAGDDKIGKKEYVINEKSHKLYVLNMRELFSYLTRFHYDKEYVNSVLEDKYFSMGNFLVRKNIDITKNPKLVKYTLDLPKNIETRNTEIISMVKDPYFCPYVPGSSLKGAVRNAILNAVLLEGQNRRFEREIQNSIERQEGEKVSRTKYLKSESDLFDTEIFNTLNKKEDKKNAVNSIFQGLTISDSKPLSTDCLILCPKVDVFSTYSRKGKNTLKNVVRECIKPGTKITFSVRIDKTLFGHDMQWVLNCIDKNYQNICTKFNSSFENTITSGDKHKIYVGGGAGFVSKTCDYLLFPNREVAVINAGKILTQVTAINHTMDFKRYHISPRTRKCTDINGRLYDFGLCSIEVKEI